MPLPIEDAVLFFRLHKALMFFVNQRLKVIDEGVPDIEAYSRTSPANRIKVHKAFLDHMDVIDAFVAENPYGFDEGDLEIIRSWRHLVAGRFYAYRPLQKHMVFLSTTEPVVAYGVVALTDPFEALLGPYLPRLLQTILLPFKGRIIFDGIMNAFNITFGPGVRRNLAESYKEAKARYGIVTSLPIVAGEPNPVEKGATTNRRATKTKPAMGSKAQSGAGPAHDAIVARTDAFCRRHLDAEYAALCRKLAGVLARKRPSPLLQGKPDSWASGIVRVIGWVNFLDDPSQPHHMRLSDIDERIGVSGATGSAKSMAIRKLLKIHRFAPEWTLPSMMEQNPMAWMIQVNGLMMDARHAPREIQEEAFRKGFIPYIPGDRADESDDG